MSSFIATLTVIGVCAIAGGCGVEEAFGDVYRENQQKAARMQLLNVKVALTYDYMDRHTLATAFQPLLDGGRIRPTDLIDPWGHTLRMVVARDRQRVICSAGPDGAFDTPDDLCLSRKDRPTRDF